MLTLTTNPNSQETANMRTTEEADTIESHEAEVKNTAEGSMTDEERSPQVEGRMSIDRATKGETPSLQEAEIEMMGSIGDTMKRKVAM